MPHQSEQEKARRKEQRRQGKIRALRAVAEQYVDWIPPEEREGAGRSQYVGNMVPTWHMDEHGNITD
jgi:hypothetical protein